MRNGTLSKLNYGWFAYAIALLFTAYLLLFYEYPPLQDYPEWIYQSLVFNDLLTRGPSDLFFIKHYPIPYTLSQLVMSGLLVFVSPLATSKIVFVVYMVAALFLTRLAVSRFELNETVAAPFFVCVFVLNSGFWNGYIAYQVGLMIFILYLCQSDERRIDPLVILLFSILLFFAHGLIYATFCLTCGIYCLYNRRIWAPAVAMLPSVFLLAWYVWENDVSLINKPFALNGIVQFVTYKVYTAMKAGPYQDFIFNGVGDSQRLRPLYLLGILVNLFFLIALVMCCASVLWKEGAKEIARRAELVSSFILMVIFLALPATLTGVVNPGERLLYPA